VKKKRQLDHRKVEPEEKWSEEQTWSDDSGWWHGSYSYGGSSGSRQPAAAASSREDEDAVNSSALDDESKLKLYYAAEAAVAKQLGLKWQQRGPQEGPGRGGPPTWRGQNYRPGSERYTNRGGRFSAWYQEKFNAIRAGLSEEDAVKQANLKVGKGEGK